MYHTHVHRAAESHLMKKQKVIPAETKTIRIEGEETSYSENRSSHTE